MKILAVSDAVVDQLYSTQFAEQYRGTDLILGCGDLPYEYLEFLVSSLNVPLLYVPGNHDPQFNPRDPTSQADGCDFLDRRVANVKGLYLAGLGGSIRYRPMPPNQYTQAQMYVRLISFLPKLVGQQIRSRSTLDIMIAHSPPRGIHDDDDPAHIGFSAFRDYIQIFKPRYFLHGHTSGYKGNLNSAVTQVGPTTVMNINPYKVLEIDPNVR